MTLRGRGNPRLMSTQKGSRGMDYVGVQWGKVLTMRLEGGQPVADVADATGGIYRSVRILSPGGGGPGDLFHRPVASYGDDEALMDTFTRMKRSEVLLLFPNTKRPHPVILGTGMHIQSRDLLTAQETDTARTSTNTGVALGDDNDFDLARKTNLRSGLDQNRGARAVLGYTGFIGLDTALLNKPIKAHVGEDMYVRLAHGLPAAFDVTERVPLAGKLFEVLDNILTLIHTHSDRIEQIESKHGQAETVAQAAKTAAEAAAPGTGAAAYAAAYEQGHNAGWTTSPMEDVAFDHDECKAAIFRISSKSKKDEV